MTDSTRFPEKRQKCIGIMTSGGDSQGMNAAVRALVRMALVNQVIPYAIYNGYQGLIDNQIKEMKWMDVQGYLSMGGTLIGTARCSAFREKPGRLMAAKHLILKGIDALIVIGGDGSLTGADKLRQEWPELLALLVQQQQITSVQQHKYQSLNIVGLVGSIDNDMSSTDMTIGCASALHRICESIDALASTAMSHSRAFVVEVMGRHCGWLAAMAAVATGADYLFVPERPPEVDDWATHMCGKLKKLRDRGQKKILVIVSEGAIDKTLKPIKAEVVRELLATRLNFDARVTTLGHVQRGGSPCFYDRFLATAQGVKAMEAILNTHSVFPSSSSSSTSSTSSPLIGIRHNEITVQPLVEAVQRTQAVSQAIDAKQFAKAMELRDPDFAPVYDSFIAMSIPHTRILHQQPSLRIGIVHIGAPAGGINAATRALVLLALNQGHVPLAIQNGIKGLIQGTIRPFTWEEVNDWNALGGSALGMNRSQPTDLTLCAEQIEKHHLDALIFIGGFEGFTALHIFAQFRSKYPSFCIPMIHLPATISNNVPGTDYSLGSDTALNVIVEACDRLKLSANASRNRVFVVETHGGNVGYLTAMGGLAGGATFVYLPEEKMTLKRVKEDVDYLVQRYQHETKMAQGRVILKNECASLTYTTDFLASILREEGQGLFDARTAVLGHVQQGGAPSPLDRIRACRMASSCIQFIESHVQFQQENQANLLLDGGMQQENRRKVYTTDPQTMCVCGIKGTDISFTPVMELVDETDFEKRRPKHAWWMKYCSLVPLLSKYPPKAPVQGPVQSSES